MIPKKRNRREHAKIEMFDFLCHVYMCFLMKFGPLKVKNYVCVYVRVFAYCVPTLCIQPTPPPEYCIPKRGGVALPNGKLEFNLNLLCKHYFHKA